MQPTTHTQIDAAVTHKIFFGAYCNFKHRCRYEASAKPPEFFTPNLIASTSDGTKFSIQSSSVGRPICGNMCLNTECKSALQILLYFPRSSRSLSLCSFVVRLTFHVFVATPFCPRHSRRRKSLRNATKSLCMEEGRYCGS